MASEYGCDTQDGNLATISVSNMQDGSVQFLCTPCAGLFGVTLIRELYPEMWTELTAPPAEPKPGRPSRKKPKPEPGEIDPNRTIAEIVEDQPRIESSEGWDMCPFCGEKIPQEAMDGHIATHSGDGPAPY